MNAYEEILAWAEERPPWQQDALRELLVSGALDDAAIARLVRLCKVQHGLLPGGDGERVRPLDRSHLPAQSKSGAVVLRRLVHCRGVNALASNQTMAFAETGLTIVYGDNGAGKSGYARLLKRFCRARVPEVDVVPNVFSPGEPDDFRQEATLEFTVAGVETSFTWHDNFGDTGVPLELTAISVFDTASASAYLSAAEKAPFAPAGLDLLEKLARLCERVKARLEADLAAEASPRWVTTSFAGTAVQAFLDGLNAGTTDEELQSIASFDTARAERLAKARTEHDALSAADPAARSAEALLRARRLETLHAHLVAVQEALSDRALDSARQLGAEAAALVAAANTVRSPGVQTIGDPAWRALWDAAKRYATRGDRSAPFPGQTCTLCEQPLAETARQRLQAFDDAIRSDIEERAGRATADLAAAVERARALPCEVTDHGAMLEELGLFDVALASTLTAWLEKSAQRRQCLLTALEGGPEGVIPVLDAGPVLDLAAQIERMTALAKALVGQHLGEERTALAKEIRELEARAWLAGVRSQVAAAIEGLRRRDRLTRCIDSCHTRTITAKSSELNQKLVTEALRAAFAQELNRLGLGRVGVEVSSQSQKGTVRHQIRLNATLRHFDAERVLSEGESRCVALAAFLAEIGIASDRSGIVFDDPVSSLDHGRRHRVAERLAHEAKTRQVVVFTHDLAFLLQLQEEAKRAETPCTAQQVRALLDGPGYCRQGLPWGGMNVKDRIAQLRDEAQQLGKTYRSGDVEAYENAAKLLFGRLREAWERAVEEVFLNGAVQRLERGVSTKPLKDVFVTDDLLATLETSMTRTSRWLPGHDDAPAMNEPVPLPEEIKRDIKILDDWVTEIRRQREERQKRRKSSTATPG